MILACLFHVPLSGRPLPFARFVLCCSNVHFTANVLKHPAVTQNCNATVDAGFVSTRAQKEFRKSCGPMFERLPRERSPGFFGCKLLGFSTIIQQSTMALRRMSAKRVFV